MLVTSDGGRVLSGGWLCRDLCGAWCFYKAPRECKPLYFGDMWSTDVEHDDTCWVELVMYKPRVNGMPGGKTSIVYIEKVKADDSASV